MIPIPPIKQALAHSGSAGRTPAIAIEGMLGAGKSTVATRIAHELAEHPLIFGMDTFIRVSRSRMKEMLAKGPIVLEEWYDLERVIAGIKSARRKERFTLKGLYNLANGQFDRDWEIDASRTDFLILEGLFAMHPRLAGLCALSIFIDIKPEIALQRAEQRDYQERNLTREQWENKLRVYWEGYKPWLEKFRDQADFIYNPQEQSLTAQSSKLQTS